MVQLISKNLKWSILLEPEVRGSHGAMCNDIFGRAPSVIAEGSRYSILEKFGHKFALLAGHISRASDAAVFGLSRTT